MSDTKHASMLLRMLLRHFYLAVSLVVSLVVSAPLAGAHTSLPQPVDFNQVDFYLLTVGRGAQIEALFGHTIMRVIDRGSGRDLSFNWGIFDFNDPLFVWKFYRGDLNYSMAINESETLIDYYRDTERRRIVQDRIVLTPKQKQALYARLVDNARPENLHYQYSQFRDNCATRPRDHLDAVLGGILQRFFAKRPAVVTRRQYINDAALPVWWVYLGLDMISNDFLDAAMSNWDEMFMPARLRELLATVPALNDAGVPTPDHKLIEGADVLVDLPEPKAAANPYAIFSILLGGTIIALALTLGRHPSELRAALVLGSMSLLFGLWSAVWGSVLSVNWLLSNYIEVKHNAILWLVWPVDWLFVLYGLVMLIRRRRLSRHSRFTRSVRFLSSMHLTGLVVGGVLCLTGIMSQAIQPALASTGISALVYYGFIFRYAAASEP